MDLVKLLQNQFFFSFFNFQIQVELKSRILKPKYHSRNQQYYVVSSVEQSIDRLNTAKMSCDDQDSVCVRVQEGCV